MTHGCNFEIIRPENRVKMLIKLREMGFVARLHAYEYVIGNGKKIVGIFMLRPEKCILEIFPSPFSSKEEAMEIIRVFKENFPLKGVVVHAVKM